MVWIRPTKHWSIIFIGFVSPIFRNFKIKFIYFIVVVDFIIVVDLYDKNQEHLFL